jgi:hypothetical protein
MRRVIFFVLLMFLSAAALAQPAADADTPLRRAETALYAVREEQRAVYQQFQMMQTLQQAEMQGSAGASSPVYVPQGQLPNYDDMARARQEQQDRLKNYAYELQQLYARYRDLGAEAAQLLNQVRILSQQGTKGAEAAK